MDILPVDEALPRLKAVLVERTAAVLVAPPGAGKTTRVPLALLDAPWLGGRKIVMQEPRRLAARAAARRMAETLGEPVGETVGYRVRFDSKVGPRTRIEVVTDGLFLRMLQDDPSLEGVGCVIFDELHERGLETDLSFALVRESQQALREDLRVIAMSATLDPGPVSERLGGAPVVEFGRPHVPGRDTLPRSRGGRPDRGHCRQRGAQCAGPGERQRAGLPAGRARDPPGRGAAGRARRQHRRGAAVRRSVAGRAGPRHRPLAARPAQGRARDLDRRDQPHHRGRADRDRRRADEGAALLAALGHDAAGDGAGEPGLGRPAARPRRPPRTRRLLPAVDRGGAARAAAVHAAGDPRRRSRAARARAGRLGRRRCEHPAVAHPAARVGAGDGARAAARSRRDRPFDLRSGQVRRRDHAARPRHGAARPASAARASRAQGPRAEAGPGRRADRGHPRRARLPARARRRSAPQGRYRLERPGAAADPGGGAAAHAARGARRDARRRR